MCNLQDQIKEHNMKINPFIYGVDNIEQFENKKKIIEKLIAEKIEVEEFYSQTRNELKEIFESSKEYTPEGIEIWRSSVLSVIFGYELCPEDFKQCILRSYYNFRSNYENLCITNDLEPDRYINPNKHIIHIGKGDINREYFLTRLACCLLIIYEADIDLSLSHYCNDIFFFLPNNR